MKKLNRLLCLVLALLMLCASAVAETTPDDVMMTVNGVPVTRATYEGYAQNITAAFAAQGYDTTDPEFIAAMQGYALQIALEYAVMDQKIAELGMALTEDEKAAAAENARAEWEAIIADGMAYYGVTDESTEEERANTLITILDDLEAQGYTEETYVDESITNAGYNKLIDFIVKDVAVTDDDVLAYFNDLVAQDEVAYANNAAAYEEVTYYNQMYAMYGMTDYVVDVYYIPHGYRAVNHILLIPDDALLTAYSDLQAAYEEQQNTLEEGGEITGEAVTEEAVESARLAIIAAVQPTIDEINRKLAEGVAFNDLIPLYCEDPGMGSAEAIAEGYNVHMDSIMWDPVFTQAAMSIETLDGVSEPVVGASGVHIVHYDHDVTGGPVELTDAMKAAFHAELLEQLQNTAYNGTVSGWMNAATVEYSEEAKAILGLTEAEEVPAE